MRKGRRNRDAKETFSEINFKTAKAHKQTINFGRGEVLVGGADGRAGSGNAEGDRYQDTVMINFQT